jgi:isopenicillin N synthase-like dioxygenase
MDKYVAQFLSNVSVSVMNILPPCELSDDVFKSTVHRAINRTGVQRYSMPLFFGTDYNVRLEVSILCPLRLQYTFNVNRSQFRAAFQRISRRSMKL